MSNINPRGVNKFLAGKLAEDIPFSTLSALLSKDALGYASTGRKKKGRRKPIGLMTTVAEGTHTRLKKVGEDFNMNLVDLVRLAIHSQLPQMEEAATEWRDTESNRCTHCGEVSE